MASCLALRLHEWAAGRFRWVQYPRMRARSARRGGVPWEYRIVLGIFGLALLGFGLVGAAVLFVFLRAAVLYA